MSGKGGNSGIMVTGGHFEAKAVAAGKNARAETTICEGGTAVTLEELRVEIDRLLHSYQGAKGPLSPEEESTAAQIRAEAQKPQPEKPKLDSLLDRLGSNAKSVSSIVTAVSAVKKLITLLVL
jgi:hypothetical protein